MQCPQRASLHLYQLDRRLDPQGLKDLQNVAGDPLVTFVAKPPPATESAANEGSTDILCKRLCASLRDAPSGVGVTLAYIRTPVCARIYSLRRHPYVS